MQQESKTSRRHAAEHLEFNLGPQEAFKRDRVSVFLLLNLLTQSYAELQMAGFANDGKSPGLAAFLREVTGLFEGRRPDVLAGYGSKEGWSGAPFHKWLREHLLPELTEEDKHCFAWKNDDYLVAFAVSKMAVELHGLFAEQLTAGKDRAEARAIGGKILAFCAHWSLVMSGDETPLPDFSDEPAARTNNK